MISGGKYWAVAGSGAAEATNPIPAANRTALTLMGAFLVGDLLAARRDLSTREPAEAIPSEAVPTHPPIRVRPLRIRAPRCQLRPQRDEFCASSGRTVERSPTIPCAEKRNSPNPVRKIKAGDARACATGEARLPPSGRRARRRAKRIARHKQGAPLRRRGSRMADAQSPPRHAVRRTQRDSDQRRRRPRRPPRFGRPAGRGPAGQKQSLSSIPSQRVSSRAWPEGAMPACQVKRARFA